MPRKTYSPENIIGKLHQIRCTGPLPRAQPWVFQQGGDPAVAVAAIRFCQSYDGLGRCRLNRSCVRYITLGTARLLYYPTGPASTDPEYRLQLDHCLAASFRA